MPDPKIQLPNAQSADFPSSTYSLLDEVIGFKALFLHSLPEAESFYRANGFNPVEVNMQPLHSVDSEYKSMYLALKEVHMNYDK